MKRLIFGDPESIKLRNEGEKEYVLNELKNIKCPLCGAKNLGYFEYDRWNERIGWNFNCKRPCPNHIDSIISSLFHNSNKSKLYTNFKGKFID